MNHSENNSHFDGSPGTDLEARVVAAVLGEASAFERAELDRLIGTNPELALFKRRIEAVHGLIGLATRPEQAPMRLAPERRAKILKAIGAETGNPPVESTAAPVILKFAEARRNRRKRWIWTSGLAASLTFAAILALYVVPSSRRFDRDQLLREEAASRRSETDRILAIEKKSRGTAAGDQEQLKQSAPVPVALPIAEKFDAFGAETESKRKDAELLTPEQRQATLAAFAAKQEKPFGTGAPDYYYYNSPQKNSPAGVNATTGSNASPIARYEDAGAKAWGGVNTDGDKEPVFGGTAEEAPIVLSPFEVIAPAERGYIASNTLAGSRVNTNLAAIPELRTQLRDSAGSLHVVAKQFLSAPNAAARDDSFLSDRTAGASVDLAKPPSAPAASAAVAEDQKLSQSKPSSASRPSPATDSPQSELSAAKEPVSTFSLHVSDVSFRLAQTALARGKMPDPDRIRPEEFYNAFDYGDPAPTAADKISCRIEQSAHPFLQQRNLVRIAMKVPATGRGAGQPLHLTVLLDTSGSMEREDRIASVRRALDVLASLLGANDRVTLIGFAREPRLLVENLPGDQASKLAELAGQTPFTGGTNLEEALKLSGELAQRHRDSTAQNRIVFITDGAANLGNADPAQLGVKVEALRQQGIAFDACGVGTDGLDDAVLEALTRKGDGRYYVLDKPEDADAGFARQLAGAFRPAAENVKVQVRFNPARVGSYRLIGFEQHRLREEDFRNDKVDAAELAADEAAVALYQIEVLPQGEGDLGEVFVRFRDAGSGQMVERSWTMAHEPRARTFDRASPSLQLAGTAALVAEKLRGGEAAKAVNLDELAPTVNALRGHYASSVRTQEFITMFEQLRRQNAQ